MSDPAPGNIVSVQVSYFRNDGVQRYWNPYDNTFSTTTQLFSTATLNTGAGTWSMPSNAIPTWITSLGGISYKIFAKAVDAAGNETPLPGATGLNTPEHSLTSPCRRRPPPRP